MIPSVYTEIRQILESVEKINKARYYTNQLEKLRDFIGKPPFALFEFRNIQYETGLYDKQDVSNIDLVVHIIDNAFRDDLENIFDLSEKVFIKLQRKGIERVSEDIIPDLGEMIEVSQTYKMPYFKDENAFASLNKIQKPNVEFKK